MTHDMLEPAIPAHLLRERTCPVKTPPNYDPPFPAYTARFSKKVEDIVMTIIGAQHTHHVEGDGPAGEASKKIRAFVENVSNAHNPFYWEPASVTDNSGAYNEVIIAYWPSSAAYLQWKEQSGFEEWWQGLDPETESNGWFQEVLFPPADRLETVFSNDAALEGVAHAREDVSGPIQEHVYWGSMRDRLAIAQTDDLVGERISQQSYATALSEGKNATKQRIKVQGKENLTVIRSGQDWSQTTPEERKLYLETMHPVLIKGMDFLRDNGIDVGCYSCRFMNTLDPVDAKLNTEKTFGLAYFNDLACLEGWSKKHKTHLDIFGRFLQYAKELQGNVSLKLFHEVLVLKADQQLFEYIGCHPGTGMLTS